MARTAYDRLISARISDVCSTDLRSRCFDGLPLGSPGAALLELAEPGLDEGLGLGVAVGASTVGDAPGGEVLAEVPGRELGPVVGPEDEHARLPVPGEKGGLDAGEGFGGRGAGGDGQTGDLPGGEDEENVQGDTTWGCGAELRTTKHTRQH